jgi:hypothetical protein
MELLNAGDLEGLAGKIEEESYFRNFVALVSNIAPDGHDIRMVGFTASDGGKERNVALTCPQEWFRQMLAALGGVSDVPSEQALEFRGVLLEADATKNTEGLIKIVGKDGRTQVLRVPRGMMSDVVKPCFEEEVVVQAHRKMREVWLDSIVVVEDATDEA